MSISGGALAIVIGVCVLAAPVAAQQTDDDRAHLHFTSGRSYFEEGNYEQALDEFRHAYDLSHRDVLLVNIANCQERLGQWRDAASSLDGYVASLAPDAEERGPMQRRVESLRQRADQHDTEEAARLAEARGTTTTTATTTTTTPAPAATPASDGLLVPAIIAFSVAGASAITWAILGGLALSDQSSIQSGCGATRSCTTDQVAEMGAFATGADVTMSIALVAAAAGAVLLIVDPPHGERPAVARLMPWGSSTGGGLVIGGTL
jgi:hypothetical protein